MISCQHQKGGSGLRQVHPLAPAPTAPLPPVTHIQEVVQQCGIFVDDQFLDLEGGGDGKEEHTDKTRVPWVQTGVCGGQENGGRPQAHSAQILALPLHTRPGKWLPESLL